MANTTQATQENGFEGIGSLFDFSQAELDFITVRNFIEDQDARFNWETLGPILQALERLAKKAGSQI